MFGNFFRFLAEAEPNEAFRRSRMELQVSERQDMIRDRVGDDKHLLVFASGGVDSAVGAALAKSVVSADRLHIRYINNGYMRDEDEGVIAMMQAAGFDMQIVNAEEYFEQATAIMDDGEHVGPLIDVIEPEHKRRIIGEAFVDVQDQIVASLGLTQDQVVLLQGTNAADRIESGNSKSGGDSTAQIKEHHNQVQRVRDLDPLEPLDDLFKDEIRALAVVLGLPDEIAYRQPFPGPGTAIRILGLKEGGFDERPPEQQAAIDSVVGRLNQRHDSQLQAKLFPVRSVGVGGDERSHIEAVALEGPVDPESLKEIASTLTGEFRNLANRVVYKLGGPELDTLQPNQTDSRNAYNAAPCRPHRVRNHARNGRHT